MSAKLILVAAAAGAFTWYPPIDRKPPRIEAITDRGLVLELIVRCPSGTAIVRYSKVERLFCGPKHECGPSRDAALRSACG